MSEFNVWSYFAKLGVQVRGPKDSFFQVTFYTNSLLWIRIGIFFSHGDLHPAGSASAIGIVIFLD